MKKEKKCDKLKCKMCGLKLRFPDEFKKKKCIFCIGGNKSKTAIIPTGKGTLIHPCAIRTFKTASIGFRRITEIWEGKEEGSTHIIKTDTLPTNKKIQPDNIDINIVESLFDHVDKKIKAKSVRKGVKGERK